jgi:hypothetical protein
MSIFGKLIKAVVNVAVLPIEIVKDVGTLGGVCTKGDFEPYTKERLEKLVEDIKD